MLFRLAEREALEGKLPRANRYASLARRIGMRYNVPLPRQFKRRVCKSCQVFLLPGVNCRVRVRRGRITYTCSDCGDIRRFPYLREQRRTRTGGRQ